MTRKTHWHVLYVRNGRTVVSPSRHKTAKGAVREAKYQRYGMYDIVKLTYAPLSRKRRSRKKRRRRR